MAKEKIAEQCKVEVEEKKGKKEEKKESKKK